MGWDGMEVGRLGWDEERHLPAEFKGASLILQTTSSRRWVLVQKL